MSRTLADRIDSLERSNRRLKAVVIGIVLMSIGLAAVGMGTPPTNVLDVKGLTLSDSKGRVRFRIECTETGGEVRQSFYDEAGVERLQFEVTASGGSLIAFLDKGRNPLAVTAVTDSGQVVHQLGNEEQGSLLTSWMGKNNFVQTLSDASGQIREAHILRDDGTMQTGLNDSSGKPRILCEVESDASVILKDASGAGRVIAYTRSGDNAAVLGLGDGTGAPRLTLSADDHESRLSMADADKTELISIDTGHGGGASFVMGKSDSPQMGMVVTPGGRATLAFRGGEERASATLGLDDRGTFTQSFLDSSEEIRASFICDSGGNVVSTVGAAGGPRLFTASLVDRGAFQGLVDAKGTLRLGGFVTSGGSVRHYIEKDALDQLGDAVDWILLALQVLKHIG